MSDVQGTGHCLFGESLESHKSYGVGEMYISSKSTHVMQIITTVFARFSNTVKNPVGQ